VTFPVKQQKQAGSDMDSRSILPYESENDGTGDNCTLPGLYIHVPFCVSKCVYCDFYSVTDRTNINRWLASLEKEMSLYSDAFSAFDTLFVGGGTPTVLEPEGFRTLFGAVRRHFTLTPTAEITVEINPDDASDELFTSLKSLDVTRLSFGVQSFLDEELSFLGRRHSVAQAVMAVETARNAGFTNIALDLIYGLPGQTKKKWLSSLERTLSLKPSHVSCYQLTVEGETRLKTMVRKGAIQLPSDSMARTLFLLTSRFFRSNGFSHYEVSNFSESADRVCRHNLKYWTHTPYLGLGPAAHSFDGLHRWWNYRSLYRYCQALEHDGVPVDEKETLTAEQLELEKIYLGLRTCEGINLDRVPPERRPFLNELKKRGLARLSQNRVSLTPRGWVIADSLPAHLS
jgi:putative oxygen-independent coproporphyrinogen III oxidase